MVQINGTIVGPGDYLGFISDVKQSGEIIDIQDDWVTLRSLSYDGFSGQIIGGMRTATIHISDTWVTR